MLFGVNATKRPKDKARLSKATFSQKWLKKLATIGF
jgi:hypothetical protein